MLNVHGKLRTEEEWCRIEDEREEQLEAEEADMVTYHGYSVSSEFAEQMVHY